MDELYKDPTKEEIREKVEAKIKELVEKDGKISFFESLMQAPHILLCTPSQMLEVYKDFFDDVKAGKIDGLKYEKDEETHVQYVIKIA